MNAVRWKQVDSLLKSAISLPQRERDAYLASACSGDQEPEREVRDLLACHNQDGSFLEHPAIEAESSQDAILESAGTVGPYRLLEKLGSGGMGSGLQGRGCPPSQIRRHQVFSLAT